MRTTLLALSEFSIQYLALFLLSSLVRYRPQTWTEAISGSVVSGETADDKSLSLIERFLEVNRGSIPELVVKLLNLHA
jgi:YaaC-like Protein